MEKKHILKLGKRIKFLIVSVTFWFQASLHVRSEVSSVWAVKPPLSLSSLWCNHVICFSHWVCFTSQNHSGTISLSGFHRRAFCHSSSTAALCLIIFAPSRASLLLDRVGSPADLVLKFWRFPEHAEPLQRGCCHMLILTHTDLQCWLMWCRQSSDTSS